ncbi:MAG: RdgB/HAM1 family non-canonical purine NTP pyrophosphatase [Lachnospiraceae bacterium]
MKVIFATGNKNKVIEIRDILKDMDAEVLTMKEAGIDIDVEENGETFLENATIKARAVAEEVRKKEVLQDAVVMADDSGLVIDALGGEPGIYSARYMGHDTSYHIKNQNLIKRLEGVEEEKRTARFVCAIAAVCPDGELLSAVQTMEGRIGYDEEGENGFGYDPIFFLPEYGCSSATISPEEKNKISHRGKALREMREKLAEKFAG